MSDVKVSDSGRRSVAARGETLSLDDCRCPVCLEIFMEPVTLPCTHTFCKACFLESVDKATMCCPLCRKRVSTWARLHSRTNTLVDQQLWTQIQRCFPLQCERRLSGQDAGAEDTLEDSVCFPRVCQPGELKQEYEDQVTKLKEEKQVLDEEERRASEEYIQRLLAEEEELLQEERRRREEDERLARQLSTQLNSSPVSQNARPPTVTPSKKKKEVVFGQMDRFLCPLPPVSNSGSFMANKENILVSQVTLQVTGGGATTTPKRKSSELDTSEDKEVVDPKRGCPSSSSTSSSSSWEEELLSRQRQEEEDRRMALLLQKELDQEEKQKATDRRKGSSDPYLLRQNSRGKVENTITPSRPSRSRRKTSTSSSSASSSSSSSSTTSSSSSPSSPSNSKQVTLTDMFSSLSSPTTTAQPEMS